ncbi:MAG: glutathione S-transferase N-terminal domain-containing protein [Ectothiorhodospiraceae bacterium]|nr:glutathione S-transferase N-terminal domain-containing protein [Ectothiorhodospiraceae bacterium]
MPEIIGRQSSHYTRLVRIFAFELELSYQFTPIFDMLSMDRSTYAGNPALKLPILNSEAGRIYGSQNICRALSQISGNSQLIIWPEDSVDPLLMNSHEILAHAMSAQVEVVIHEIVENRTPDNTSRKRRQSLVNCLAWLNDNFDLIIDAFPARDISIFEISLYCLVSHLHFRNTLDLSAMPNLRAFEQDFGNRRSVQATPYRFDKPPHAGY